MKYIRTIDKIYELTGSFAYPEDTIEHILHNVKALGITRSPYLIMEDDIIKSADSIEELCDEFICSSNEKGNDFRKNYISYELMLRDDFYQRHKKHYNFYAGIWVKDKGLIYVAKLNEKGELELL